MGACCCDGVGLRREKEEVSSSEVRTWLCGVLLHPCVVQEEPEGVFHVPAVLRKLLEGSPGQVLTFCAVASMEGLQGFVMLH